MKNKRSLFIFITSFISLILVSLIIVFIYYFNSYINKKITETSLNNITETYSEISKMFEQNSKSQFNYLSELGNYLYVSDNDDEVKDYINELKEQYNFTYFYFIYEDGTYYEINGETGRLNLGNRIFDLDEQIIESSLPKKDELILYTKNVKASSFNNFSYSTIAFGYDKVNIKNIIDASSYNDSSVSYLVSSNGKIRISFDTNQLFYNLFEFLSENSNITSNSYNDIMKDFNDLKNNNYEITINGTNYYMVYSYTNVSDFMIITFTPKSIVDSSLTSVKNISIIMISVIISILVLVLFTIGIYVFVKSVNDKNNLIKEREELFYNATKNLDEIYILYSLTNNKVKYVSRNIERLLGISYKDILNDINNLYICKINNNINLNMFRTNNYYEDYLLNIKTNIKSFYSIESRLTDDFKSVIIVLTNKEYDLKIREEIETSLQLAKIANDAKTIFLSNISHDIRTPMNAIIGFSNLIKKDPGNINKTIDYLDKILISSNHLLSLLNDILDASKIESGKIVLNIKEINVYNIVSSLVNIIEPQILNKKQTFNLINNINKDYLVYADETRLSQILLNILTNAYKYTNEGGLITFEINELIASFSYITYNFKISDNGIGMSQEFLDKLFIPFEREHSKYESKVEGTGLGMAITKNLIDMMNGSIAVSSKQGVGSTFNISLTFKLKEDVEIKEETYKKPISLKGLKVLACEDNVLNKEILYEMLSDEGLIVDIVTCGHEAIDKAYNNKYDFILMDIQMPIMDGYETTKLIRNKDKKTPIIAMTASNFKEDEIKAYESGMNGFISKPININELLNAISKLLYNQK